MRCIVYGVVKDHYQYEKDEYDTKIKENNEYYEDEDGDEDD